MEITYRLRFDISYFRTVIDRQYRQGPFLLRLPVQFSVVGAVIACAVVAASGVSVGARMILFAVVYGLIAVGGVLATKQALLMKFKNGPGFGSESVVTLAEDGVMLGNQPAAQRIDWSNYPSSVRFDDGILLKKPRSVRWLPDAAIQTGSSAEATSLIESRTMLRYIR